MIGFRQTDARFPFLFETAAQPERRWHGAGEGPAQYLADTPDGAWAEFVRHQDIRDPEDLAGIERVLWAVELPDETFAEPELAQAVLTGDLRSYKACQAEARRLRRAGHTALRSLSAALLPKEAGGWGVDGGLRRGPERDGEVVVLFGARPGLIAWRTGRRGGPDESLLGRVRYLEG